MSKAVIAAAVVILIVGAAIVYYKPAVLEYILPTKIPTSSGDEGTSGTPNIPVPPETPPANETNETIGAGGIADNGGGGGGSSQAGGPNVFLEIFNLCAGDLVDEESGFNNTVGNATESCVNIKNPYYIILEKNSTHIRTSFYNGIGFNRTYVSTSGPRAFIFYMQDINTIGVDLEDIVFPDEVIFSGDMRNYISMGSYSQQTVYDPTEKTYGWVSLHVDPAVPSTGNWKNLRLHFNTPLGIYYIGDMWFYVTEM